MNLVRLPAAINKQMEYAVGPILALLLGMKFTDYKSKELAKKYEEYNKAVEEKIVAQNELISTQTLKVLTPVVKSVTKINEQLGL